MKPLLPALALFVLATECPAAETWYRCRLDDGSLAYQPKPCERGDEAAGALAVVASPAAPARGRAPDQAQVDAWARRSRDRLPPSLGGRAAPAAVPRTPSTRRPEPDARTDRCAKAREAREQAYARNGLDMDFDRRRELQDAVTAACGLR
jgi:hypothetical protein